MCLKINRKLYKQLNCKRGKRTKMKLEIGKLTKEVVNMGGVCIK
jgi:hypothetical protein